MRFPFGWREFNSPSASVYLIRIKRNQLFHVIRIKKLTFILLLISLSLSTSCSQGPQSITIDTIVVSRTGRSSLDNDGVDALSVDEFTAMASVSIDNNSSSPVALEGKGIYQIKYKWTVSGSTITSDVNQSAITFKADKPNHGIYQITLEVFDKEEKILFDKKTLSYQVR